MATMFLLDNANATNSNSSRVALPPPPPPAAVTAAEAMSSAAAAYAAAAAVAAAGIPPLPVPPRPPHPQSSSTTSGPSPLNALSAANCSSSSSSIGHFYPPPPHFGTVHFDGAGTNYLAYPPPSLAPPTAAGLAQQQQQQQHYSHGMYPSLFFRQPSLQMASSALASFNANDLYQLDSPCSLAPSTAHPKLPPPPAPYRGPQLAFDPQQHASGHLPLGYASIGGPYGPSPHATASADWTGGRGDIYLRVGATLEIGTAPGTSWHSPAMNLGNGDQQNAANLAIMDSFAGLQLGQQQQIAGGFLKTERGGGGGTGLDGSGMNSQNILGHNPPLPSGLAGRGERKAGKKASASLAASVGAGKCCYACTVCGRQYCRKSTLKAHMKHHIGDRPFNCQVCGKHFSQAANLTAHRRVHTGEKPFCCSVCLRPFSQSSSLVTHKRTHTGERPYPCPHCEKAFTDSSTLTKHLRTHTGHKPYSCALCLMKFSQSGNLHRHMKTHMNSGAPKRQ